MPDGCAASPSSLLAVTFVGALPYTVPLAVTVSPWGPLDVRDRRGETRVPRRDSVDTARRGEALLVVRRAFSATGLPWPRGRITVHAREPSLPSGLGDLTFAMALLNSASLDLRGWAFLAELRGEHLCPPRGLLGALRALSDLHGDGAAPLRVVVPTAARSTVAGYPGRLDGVRLVYAATLGGALRAVSESLPGALHAPSGPEDDGAGRTPFSPRGALRRALLVAAATGAHVELHNAGPGDGAAFARTLAALLPAHDEDTARALSETFDLAGLSAPGWRPGCRALPEGIGADDARGSDTRPGPFALSHRGVLMVEDLAAFSEGTRNALLRVLSTRDVDTAARPSEPADVQMVSVEAPAFTSERAWALRERRRRWAFDGLPRGCLRVDLSRELQPAGDDDAPMTLAAARYVVETVRRAYGYRMASPPLRAMRGADLSERVRLALAALGSVRGFVPRDWSSEAAALTPERPS